MLRSFAVAALLLMSVAAQAVESGSQLFTIIRAEMKTRDRAVYWVVNTPLYREDPYLEVEVRAQDRVFVAECEVRGPEMLPTDWKSGTRVRGQVEGHQLYLRRPSGTDLKLVIVKRKQVSTAQ